MCSTLSVMVLISMMGCVELAITVETTKEIVNVTAGESVLLPCTYNTTSALSEVSIEWTFASSPSSKQQVYFYKKSQESINEQYRGRLQAFSSPDKTKNASIMISKMQPSDTGVYTCEVEMHMGANASITVFVHARSSAPPSPYHIQYTGPRGLLEWGIGIAVLLGIILVS
ncbi:V-set and immunoglobulin domain-containing protein 1-like [Myripristis murdjan]|uniref:V-set and immunoglobulin domain-containing protein 1-like n=1 Tax=Myripristis murdjan TaxID=586833 RepID=UPI001175DFB4|nr:V-set and immunoglobulin domain-containing protein 1-like [Myripristis murdjan]